MMILLASLVAVLPWMICQGTRRNPRLLQAPQPAINNGQTVPIGVVLELVVSVLQTGASIPRALIAVGIALPGREGSLLKRAGRQLELGAPWANAWRDSGQELELLCEGLRQAWEAGTSPTASLRTAGETARRKQMESSRLAAARLAVRLVLPLGLCLLPAFILIGLVPVLMSLGSGIFAT